MYEWACGDQRTGFLPFLRSDLRFFYWYLMFIISELSEETRLASEHQESDCLAL